MEIQPIECELCGKEIRDPRRYKTHLDLHQKRKEYTDEVGNIKMQLELDQLNKVKKYSCEFCGKNYTTPYTLKKHLEQICQGQGKGHDIVILEQAYKILEKSNDIGKIRQFIYLLEDKVKVKDVKEIDVDLTSTIVNTNQGTVMNGNQNTSTTNTSTNTIKDSFNSYNNNSYNIAINNLNHENTEYLVELLPTLKDQLMKIGEHDSYIKHVKQEAFDDMKKILIELYSLIHLNDDHMENQNIYISNLKQNIPFFIHVNDEWVRYGSMDHLYDVVDKVYRILNDSLTRLIELSDDAVFKDELINAQTQIQDIYPLYEDQLKKNVGRQCFQLTYGNRDNISRIYKATKPLTLIERRINELTDNKENDILMLT